MNEIYDDYEIEVKELKPKQRKSLATQNTPVGNINTSSSGSDSDSDQNEVLGDKLEK